ncbi:glycosyltransferase [Alkaliphilus transvaalensis]|uniref:glycosyltransferase n=1 Tax=Alkaliphilus transvaalensis TaxID=114628 RepID=UPI00047CB60F|nr:glycosyltransferase [Alkaliphilus transvaalensis]
MKKKVLFFGEGIALSHIVRPLYLARCLDKEKYEISFACSEAFKGFVEGKVDHYYEIPSMSPGEFEKRLESPKKIYDNKILSQYIDSELQLLSEVKPDVVIGDMRATLAISARQANIPYINISNAYWSPFSTQERQMPEIPALEWMNFKFRMKFMKLVFPLVVKGYIQDYNKNRVKIGLPPVKSMQEMHCDGDWNLYVDTPTLAPTYNLPKSHQYIGPITEFIDNELPDWWHDVKNDKPIIYFTVGSTGNVAILKPILEVLKKLPVTVLMSTAGRDLGTLPSNFYVSKYLPALLVIEKSDLVICNGTGGLYQALSKGKPVLAFTKNMDQFLAMDMVEKNGAGKLIRPCFATEDYILQNIEAMLQESSWKKNAQKIQSQIEKYNPKTLFIDVIDHVVNH